MPRFVQLSLAAMLCAFICEAQISSTFDTDADGWTFANSYDGTVTPILHTLTGGNPGGYISLTYTGTPSSNQSWIAPAKFDGSWVVRSYGMNLKISLRQSHTGTSSFSNGEVRLLGNGLTLVYSFPAKPAQSPAWSAYSIKLDETGGWRINNTSGALATRAQMISALSNVTGLEIRGTYVASVTSAYTSGLDEVIVEQKTLLIAPVVSSIDPAIGVAGDFITITGTDFDPVASNNAVYFGGISGSIQTASATELVVEIPQRAQYGPISVINKTTGLVCRSFTPFSPMFPDGGRIIPSSLKTKTDLTLTGITDIHGLAAADIDGDGWSDVIVSESGSTTSVLRNLGSGGDITPSSFAAKVSIPVAGGSSGLTIADLDGDGKQDIAAAYATGSLMSFVTIRNTSTPGSISFESPELWAGLVYSGSLSAVVDVDGDGRLDLIGQHGNGSVSPDFWIAHNISTPGNIDFGASKSYFGGSTLDAGSGVSYGDLDNDGKPEMLVEYSFGGRFQIIKNNSVPGEILFGTPFMIDEGVSGGIVVADFNLDGLNDIAFKQGSNNDDVRIRLNTFAGGILSAADFATEVVLNTDIFTYGGLSIADINGDGKADIMISDNGNIAVFENVYTGGVFNSSAFVPGYLHQGAGTATYPTTPVAADFNGDNKLDIVIGITNINPNTLSFFQNANIHTPEIALTTVSPLAGPVGSKVTITGDYFSTTPANNLVRFGGVSAEVIAASRTELTVLVPVGAAYGPVTVTRDELTARYHLPFNVLFSPGTTLTAASFGSPVNFAVPTADFDIDAADLDGDNKIDLVVEGASQQSYFLRNAHTSGSISASSLVSAGNTTSGAANPKLIDLNGDGKPDITSVQGAFRNTSTGTAISFDATSGLAGTTNIGYADFNHDGGIDVVGISGTVVEVHENRMRPGAFVSGTFASLSDAFNLASGGTAAVASAVADFDNNGFADIAATVSSATDNIVVFKNNGGYRISVSQFSNAGTFATFDLPGRIYEGDLDVDGKMDLVIYNQAASTNGSNYISIFHNTTISGTISFSRVDYQLGTLTGATGTIGGPSAISDLDGDGRPEIIVTSASTTAARQGFYIFKNNSSPGTINASSFASSGLIALSGARAVAAADLNLDHRPELIFTRTGSILSVMENLVTPTTLTFTTQPVTATLCDVMDADLTVAATGDNNLQYTWQKLNTVTGKYEDVPDDATYEGVNSQTLDISYPPLVDTYRAVVQGDYSLAYSASAVLTVSTTPSAPTTTGDSECSGSPVVLTASGGSNGKYRWYAESEGGTPIAGETNATYTTPILTTSTPYFVALNNNGCESSRASVMASIITVAAPSVTNNARCDAGTVNLSASGGANGEYRWYTLSAGGSALPGEVNNAFTTPSLTGTTSYFVARNDGTCESTRTEVIATINAIPAAPAAMNNARCDSGQLTLEASGSTSGNYRWYTASSGGTALAGETNATFTTPSISSTTSFFVSQIVNNCESLRAEAIAAIGTILAPAVANVSACANSTTTLTASGGSVGQYRWYTSAVGGTPIAGESNNVFTTPNLSTSTSYFVSLNNGTCESARSQAIITITTLASPTANAASRCGSGTLTLTSSGGSNGNYRWYSVPTGGTAIAGAVNDSFTTPSLSVTTSYYVAVTDGTCESTRTAATASINTPPSKPVITSGSTASGNTVTICTGSVTLTAPGGFIYLWSSGATTQQITASSSGSYSVQITDANNCTSVSSDVMQVIIDATLCNNPPVINSEGLTAEIEGSVTLDLSTIISDPDNNVDLSSITIVSQPQSGAVATISNGQLRLDYSGVSFSGTDVVTIRVCDLAGSCITENLTIEVIGDIEVFNAISPNGDGLNDFLRIQYIEVLDRTRNNKVTVLNRWGDKVFEVSNYDNNTRIFKGLSSNGAELASGTYFYKIEFAGQDAPPMKTGYLSLKR